MSLLPLSSISFGVAIFRLAAAIAADDGEDFSRDVAGACRGGEEYERGRDLFGLRSAPHRRMRAEARDALGVAVGRVERCPHRTGRHHVDADAAIDQERRE